MEEFIHNSSATIGFQIGTAIKLIQVPENLIFSMQKLRIKNLINRLGERIMTVEGFDILVPGTSLWIVTKSSDVLDASDNSWQGYTTKYTTEKSEEGSVSEQSASSLSTCGSEQLTDLSILERLRQLTTSGDRILKETMSLQTQVKYTNDMAIRTSSSNTSQDFPPDLTGFSSSSEESFHDTSVYCREDRLGIESWTSASASVFQ